MAVTRAVRDGRLTAACVMRDADGRPLGISDFAIADREWEANTSADHRERAMGSAATPAVRVAPLACDEDPTAREGMTKSEADTVSAIWKARTVELEFKQAAGELVPARDVAHKMADVFTACRTKLMGLPSRARQDLPHLSVADIGVIDGLVREALEDLAAEGTQAEQVTH